MDKMRFKWDTCGKALDENVVKGENYRFTVLTSRLIRMEYSKDGIFEDRASQHFFYRNLPKNLFYVEKQNGFILIITDHLILKYKENSEFSADTLSIAFKEFSYNWRFGENAEQLMGTARTLDKTNGWSNMEEGLCSRNGYAVVDDSGSALLTEDGWFDIRRENNSDFYFFGYGRDYLNCIKDLYRVTGAPPLLPDYALGNWWSRYYDYTQEEYCNLIKRFEKEDIPFSVAVIDMGWHTQPKGIEENRIDYPRYSEGWTGYSWNRELFPDYKEFLKFLKEHNLKTSLNLHPACGIGCHEDMYTEMATACGIDPKTKKLVKFDCLNPEFMANYFDILHHPYEENGVDFWWMDWQQGTDYWWIHDDEHEPDKLEIIDPLWLLNHLHIVDIMRNGKRPMFFSRYAGLGSHRYSVGFSGDATASWESFNYQPYFTANASNVGYSWWSHDIGGHCFGYRDDELIVRWYQYGVLSPINRLHACNNPFMRKEPWSLHPYMAQVAKDWLKIRYRLFPYIYTMNYRNHNDLIPMILPMYYTHPESEAAYKCPNQYWFGSEMFVSPITEKADKYTFRAPAKVWFPKGKWIDALNGYVYNGEREKVVYRTIEQFPIFAKEGAIIPAESLEGNKQGKKTDMEVYVFSGADNKFTLYEDAGDGDGYKNGEWVKTDFSLNWGNNALLTVEKAQGDLSLIQNKRNWTIHFRGFNEPENIVLKINGTEIATEFCYDKSTATITITVNKVLPTDRLEILCVAKEDIPLQYDNRYILDKVHDIIESAQTAYLPKMKLWDYVNSENHDWMYGMLDNPEHKTYCYAIIELLDLYDNK